jgi:dipeptidyl aminopeptidase/acylaminoacyl peptidase
VFAAKSMKEALEKAKPFTLDGNLDHMKCPYLIVHGGYDVLGVSQATRVHDYAKSKGVDVTLRFLTQEETGAEHCQHDNATIGQELMADWLADRFKIDQAELRKKALNPMI